MKLAGARRIRRWIELELAGQLDPSRSERLRRQLRIDPQARAHYDRCVAALRALSGNDDMAPQELELVEGWLLPENERRGRAAFAGLRRPWMWGLAATACALALFVLLPREERPQEGPAAKGGDGWPALALQATCLDSSSLAGDPLGAARVDGCHLDQVLGLAYRVRPSAAPEAETLTLFGVDAEGRILYYAPTPEDRSGIMTERSAWHAAGTAVQLIVNHRPGALRIYGLLSPAVPTVTDVEQWAARLRTRPPASPGDEPWHRTIGSALGDPICPTADDCHSAELHLTIHEAQP